MLVKPKKRANMQSPDFSKAEISRRNIICTALAATALGFIPEVAHASNNGITQLKSGKLQIDLKSYPALNKAGGALQIPLSDGSSVALVRVGAAKSAFSAINLACTHQGVTVQEMGNMWVCPAHGSEFTLAGKVVRGPAQVNLQKYPVQVNKNFVVIG